MREPACAALRHRTPPVRTWAARLCYRDAFMRKRTIIVGDLHLTRETPKAVRADLVRLLSAHPGSRFVVAGDLFDLSADGTRKSFDEPLAAAVGAMPEVGRALAEHLDRDGEIWLVSGNHDAEVGEEDAVTRMADALGVRGAARARLSTSAWFMRDANVHIEHGHVFDPDNAPRHPLDPEATSLGVHFVEEFIQPTGAHAYLNANDGTPLKLFLSAFSRHGLRGPYIVYRYFHAAFSALARSGACHAHVGRPAADDPWVSAWAARRGIEPDCVRDLIAQGAEPTLASRRRTFMRLYLDRVFATVATASGAAICATGQLAAGGALSAAGALGLVTSWAIGHNRYRGRVSDALREGAKRVRDVSGAKLVVFGHTHRPDAGDGYANTASFAFAGGLPGRPYLVVDDAWAPSPRADRLFLAPLG